MSKLIIANWKMNPSSVLEAIDLAKETDCEDSVICPPFPFIKDVGLVIKKAKLGAQDVFWKNPAGPFTGEVSAAELKSLGVEYIIIGHSERRKLGETNEMISQKLTTVLETGLTPILCVGETLEQKNSGQKEKVISEQIKVGFSKIENWKLKIENFYIAYEPIWAISVNPGAEVDSPENTLKTIDFIKKELVKLNIDNANISFLYGGSVNSINVESFLKHSNISGVLVGGASLKPEEINKIINIANRY